MLNTKKINEVSDIIIKEIETLLNEKNQIAVAIDGRCAAGKTTLAQAIQDKIACAVVHMDDFFLRPEQRTKERLEIPGANVDYERLQDEVLTPLCNGQSFSYQRYDCRTQSLKEPILVPFHKVTIIEGAYSCNPNLWNAYDLHIFLDIAPKEQMDRIRSRNGEQASKRFEELWIPLEENYFTKCGIKEKCELYF